MVGFPHGTFAGCWVYVSCHPHRILRKVKVPPHCGTQETKRVPREGLALSSPPQTLKQGPNFEATNNWKLRRKKKILSRE